MIQTVNGLLDAEKLGITMCHEHLALDLSKVRGDKDSCFDDRALIIEEVNKMKAYGAQAVVEVTCNDMGRDVGALKEISDICGIHVIASTGYYLEPYHSRTVKESSEEELCEVFLKDIMEGMDGSGIKAGVIGEVAAGEKEIAPSERKVLTAAAKASVRTGLAVTTHCQLGRLGLEQAALLLREGMDPDKIILGHLDLADDRAYYEQILHTGVNIGFDTIGKISYLPDSVRAEHLMWLLEKGYEEHIVLSQDVSRKSYLSVNGRYSGYMAVMKDFVPMLRKRGITEEALEKLLIQNPARILNIAEPQR